MHRLPNLHCHSNFVRLRRGVATRSLVIAAGIVLVVAWIGLRLGVGPGLPEIQPDDLAVARDRWQAAGVTDYDIAITLSGRQSGEIKVQVRAGQPTAMTRNGIQPKQERTWQPWTVPGMFDTIDVDFDNRTNAKEKFGTEPESVHLRCLFDPELGFPRRYLHQVYGRQQDLEWTVTEFTRR
jgi:hypothetical protein